MPLTQPVRRATTVLLALLTALAVVLVVPPVSAQENGAEVAVDRIFGPNRVATAIEVSAETFPDGAPAVVLARPDVYVDALAAGPLAAAVNGPILLAGDADDLGSSVSGEIARLDPQTVYIVGGEAAVSADVETALARDYTVERLAGPNRFATAQSIISELEEVSDVDTVVVVKGVDADDPTQGFADALSASWWAGQHGYAIAPVRTDEVPPGHVEVLGDAGVTNFYIVGGEEAVSADVETALGEDGAGLSPAGRLAGDDRYETSAIVWDTGIAQGADPTQRWTARGDVFADALSAGPAVAEAGFSFVLVDPTAIENSPASAQVFANSPEYLDRVVILGGTAAVSEDVETAIGTVAGFLPLDDVDYCLTVLHNNDGESQLIESANGPQYGGVARFASVVERERSTAQTGFPGDGCSEDASVLLNSGDNFLAGAEFEASQTNDFSPFYDAVALDAIDYDAFAVGNHEFDFGPEVLADFITAFGGDTPFVSVNLQTEGTALAGLIDPSTTVQAGSRTVGVIGASPTNLAQISSPGDVGVLSFDDTVDAVNAEAARLRAEEGVDIVILQSHLQNITNDLELIARTSGIDIAIAGGGDETLGSYGNLYLPEEGAQDLPAELTIGQAVIPLTYPVLTSDADAEIVPIVTTPGDYEYLGRLRARFDDTNTLDAVDPRSRLVRVVADDFAPDGVVPDAEIVTQVVEPVADFVAQFEAQVIGTNEVPLNGQRTEVRTRQTNVGSLLTDSYIYAVEQAGTGGPTVAIANGGGIRNDSIIETGDFTVGEAVAIAPFGNSVVTFADVTAEQLKALLERGFSGLPAAEGRYSQVGGITVEVDVSRTAQEVNDAGEIVTPGERVRSVTLTDGNVPLVVDGEPVAGAPTFNLATAGFTADGGDNYPFADVGLTPDLYSQVSSDYRVALQNYVAESTGLDGVITAAEYPQNPDRVVITGD